mmetsp:Transcript_22955/g.54390  ORF Transcript_22955/g.54390 Transcript_22955/m.54390 type:complete len:508 (+) Transcript_22955:373-1896(+)
MTEHGNSDDGYTDIGNTMDGAARRAGQWKLEWQKKNQDLDAVKDRILVSNFFRDATFASAFLAEKRKSRRPADTDLTIPVVFEGTRPIAFGHPCDWKKGIAARMIANELSLANIHFRVQEEDLPMSGILPRNDSLLAVGAEAIFIEWRALTNDGGLSYQEDRYVVQPEMERHPELQALHLPTLSFFGVYDGHGGKEAADYLVAKLHANFAKELKKLSRSRICVKTALKQAFKATDRALIDMISANQADQDPPTHVTPRRSLDAPGLAPEWRWSEPVIGRHESSGAAAAAALLIGKDLYVAHLGDCRVVLCRGGECKELTKDHTHHNWAEKERVDNDGGSWEQERLNGVLSVCRAFGDFDYGNRTKHKGLSADPDVRQEEIADDDEFLLVASDGLWSEDNGAYGGFRTASEAVAHMRRQLTRNNNDVDAALESLISSAIKATDSDNTTVVAVLFKKLPQLPEEPVEYKPITFSKERPRFFNSKKGQAPSPAAPTPAAPAPESAPASGS